MRKIVTEVEGEGLMKLLGQNVALLCLNYIYAGKLIGVNDDCVLLEEAKLVYETGEWGAKKWQDAQDLPGPWYVALGAIESYGISGR